MRLSESAPYTGSVIVGEELLVVPAETLAQPAHLGVAARVMLPEILDRLLVHQICTQRADMATVWRGSQTAEQASLIQPRAVRPAIPSKDHKV